MGTDSSTWQLNSSHSHVRHEEKLTFLIVKVVFLICQREAGVADFQQVLVTLASLSSNVAGMPFTLIGPVSHPRKMVLLEPGISGQAGVLQIEPLFIQVFIFQNHTYMIVNIMPY